MRRPEVIFDITRLATRFSRPTPNGIDRVDVSYAEHFLSEARGGRGALLGPAGVRAVDNRAARIVVDAIVGHWHEGGVAEEDEAYRRLLVRLGGMGAAPHNNEPTRRPSHLLRSVIDLLRRGNTVGTKGLFLGRNLVKTAPRDSVYFNISQFPLWLDWYFRWLDRRPDIKPVFFVHDILPISYPEFFPPAEARRHEGRMQVVARRSRGIIVASDDTRRALEQQFQRCGHVPAMCVIPLPASATFAKPEIATPIPMRRPYFISVGTIEPRKNQLLLLNIWRELVEQLGDRTPTLILAGVRGWDNENVVDMLERCHSIRPYIIEISGLSTPSLQRVMAGARAVLMPTLAEGFGLPAAEARSLGVPLIVSNVLRFELQSGEPTTMLDPLDGPAWRDAIMAHAFGDPRPHDASGRKEHATLAGWELHLDHVEEFIQSL